MVERAGVEAKLGFKAHPHMLRHACGFALANKGHDTRSLQAYLGHKNIQHTVRYTDMAPGRFKNFWDGSGSEATLAGILPNGLNQPLTTPATLILCQACERRHRLQRRTAVA